MKLSATPWTARRLAVFCFCAALLAGCTATMSGGSKGNRMTTLYSDPVFDSVQPDSFNHFPCSPKPEDPEFRGILISGPEVVRFSPDGDRLTGTFAVIPVCGSATFDSAGIDLSEIVLLAVDTTTHKSFSGKIGRPRNLTNASPAPGKAGLKGAQGASILQRGYFNPNLTRVVSLPARAAEYEVFATLRDHKSNVIRIRVEEQGGD